MDIDDRPTEQLSIVHHGSVKIIRRAGEHVLAFEHTDRFSVFDCGPHPQEIPGMGEALCRCNVAGFKIAAALCIPTHFIREKDGRTILVREFATPKDRPLYPEETDVMIPLEFIDRERVSGSIRRALESGKKKPTNYGFASNDFDKLPREGTPFPFPVHECTTKWEKVDRPLEDDEAMRLGGISREEWQRAWALIDRLNGALSLAARASRFTRLDGKKELAFMGPERQIVFIDAFGNPHEDRYAPTAELEEGIVIHHSKEFLRQLFVQNGFYADVQKARAAGEADPPYPSLTTEQIGEASERFSRFSLHYEQAVGRIVSN
ncbi:MAG: phosphoribosylaminoimidazolesuccinocarboxamide synthase [Candidatus Taylorbacteria bacterium]